VVFHMFCNVILHSLISLPWTLLLLAGAGI
jgi:hypothetical protein